MSTPLNTSTAPGERGIAHTSTAAASAVRRETVPAVRRETVPAVRRETVPAVRRETVPAVRRETVPAVRRETVTAVRRETVPAARTETVPAALPLPASAAPSSHAGAAATAAKNSSCATLPIPSSAILARDRNKAARRSQHGVVPYFLYNESQRLSPRSEQPNRDPAGRRQRSGTAAPGPAPIACKDWGTLVHTSAVCRVHGRCCQVKFVVRQVLPVNSHTFCLLQLPGKSTPSIPDVRGVFPWFKDYLRDFRFQESWVLELRSWSCTSKDTQNIDSEVLHHPSGRAAPSLRPAWAQLRRALPKEGLQHLLT
ncbi:uncharacterized protein LOC135283353 [Passer domesticus]|uniref:uncharacterized protein LOC135283353 n=1 Tax=Passer domesticus TaxID=48849 RepID=UPI0030FE0B67